MYAFPELDIYFPENEEATLAAHMRERAGGLWRWQRDSPVGRPVEAGQYFFHRDEDEIAPPCTVCLGRKEPGHLWVPNVTPDSYGVNNLDVKGIINDFDNQIAARAAEVVGGYTSIGTDKHTLEGCSQPGNTLRCRFFCRNHGFSAD